MIPVTDITVHFFTIFDLVVITVQDANDDFDGVTHSSFHVCSLENKYYCHYNNCCMLQKKGIVFNLRNLSQVFKKLCFVEIICLDIINHASLQEKLMQSNICH